MSKTWFITGTSSGFGRLMTESLLARGDRMAATLRKVEALDDLKAQHSERLWVARLDVTDATAVRRVMDQAFGDLGRIDVVVNNAAYGLVGAAEELTDDQIRQIPTLSARSKSSARRCRTCVRRAAAASCRCRPKAARSPIPPSASITRPSGESRVRRSGGAGGGAVRHHVQACRAWTHPDRLRHENRQPAGTGSLRRHARWRSAAHGSRPRLPVQ